MAALQTTLVLFVIMLVGVGGDEPVGTQLARAEALGAQTRLGEGAVRQLLAAALVEQLQQGDEQRADRDTQEEGDVDAVAGLDDPLGLVDGRQAPEEEGHGDDRHERQDPVAPEHGQQAGAQGEDEGGAVLDRLG